MKGRLLIYGSTGRIGAMLAQRLREAGAVPILAARNGEKVARQASELGLGHRAFALDDPARIDAALADIDVVLHAAGPFVATAAPMIDACIRSRVHYLDLSGEWPGFAEALDRSVAASHAGVMLMPGVGFSVVMSDCLLALVAEQNPGAIKLRLAVSKPGEVSAASIRSLSALLQPTVLVRRGGALRAVAAGRVRNDVDFGAGLAETTAVCWPDLITAPITTGIDDIETYAETDWLQSITHVAAASASRWLDGRARRLAANAFPLGLPVDPRAEKRGFTLVAQAIDRWRRASTLSMVTDDGYGVSAVSGAEIARRVLAGDWAAGFRTPAGLFGGGFALELGCARLTAPLRALSVQGA